MQCLSVMRLTIHSYNVLVSRKQTNYSTSLLILNCYHFKQPGKSQRHSWVYVDRHDRGSGTGFDDRRTRARTQVFQKI